MPKDSIRDHLDGNELDLSLNNLSVVPVKELATIPKATNLDLSCNVLTSLPDSFCSLSHLVKIDLSKNNLSSLPTKFGSLSNLQHLDLLGNQLELLPLSFCNLLRLKWLDLKDNPLEAGLKKAAGDCLDETQCRQCAKSVLLYMKNASSEAERRKQKRLQDEREKEAAEKRKEEEERLRKKEEKKAEKERKKQLHKARLEQENKERKEDNHVQEEVEPEFQNGPSKTKENVRKRSCFGRCCGWLFTLLMMLVVPVVGVYLFCENTEEKFCVTYYEPVKNAMIVNYNVTKSWTSQFLESQFGNNTVSDFLSGKLSNATG